ncbi:MAG: leucine-rich repeat protein, partial [Treponema sp.]|nr:leucine-rich repeat protein [Treponema sp.]
MKKYLCGLLLIIPLLFGCSDPAQELLLPADSGAIAAGTGRVIIGKEESRTILPQTPVFVSYLLSFEYKGEGEVEKGNQQTDSLPCAVDLSPGDWLITVTAYTRIEGVDGLTDGIYPAAEGSTTVTVSSGVSVSVTVNLSSGTGIAGDGVFEYEIGLPVSDLHGAALRVLNIDRTEAASKDLLEAASGAIVLDAGYYLLQVKVTTGRARSKTEMIHIYSGHTTRAAGSGWNFNTEEGVYLSAAELSEFLEAAPVNTVDTPYTVKLNVDLQSLSSRDSYNYIIVLGALFDALHGKFIDLDLSNASGELEAVLSNHYSTASSDKDKLVSVLLPETLTYISHSTFSGCTSLNTINFPNSLQKIGTSAFNYCSSLVSIDLSACSSLVTIEGSVFTGCSSLEEVKLPDSVETIGGHAFSGCTSLAEMVFPASLRSLGNSSIGSGGTSGYTFQDSGIVRADFSRCAYPPEWVWWCLFSRCKNLNEVILNPAITSIGMGMFAGCTSLENITLPASLKAIGEQAFDGCTLLGTVALPATVESIDSRAFDKCTNLVLDISPNSALKSIGANAFRDCSNYCPIMDFSGLANLTSIDLTAYTALESLNLSGCVKLPSVNLTGFTALTGLNLSGCTTLPSIDLTSNTALESLNLSGCTQLKTITAPNLVNLEQVDLSGSSASTSLVFSGCTSLADVKLPASANIGSNTFTGCTQAVFSVTGTGSLSVDETGRILKSGTVLVGWHSASGAVTIPEGITGINGGALEDTITALTLPSTITTSFANVSNALKDLPSVQTIDFSLCDSITTIESTTQNNYLFMDVMCAGATVIFPSSIKDVYSGFSGSEFNTLDFSACTGLRQLNITNCASLETVMLPVIPYLGLYSNSDPYQYLSIYGCPSLTTFEVQSTGYFKTLENGTILTDSAGRLLACPSANGNVYIPDGIISINGMYTFRNNTMITSISLSPGLTGIDGRSFTGCTNLASFDTSRTSTYSTKESGTVLCSADGKTLLAWPSATGVITLSSGITAIAEYVFENNLNITAVDFSNSNELESIGRWAFSSCANIETVNLSGCTALVSIIDSVYGTFSECSALASVDLSGCTALVRIGNYTFYLCTALTSINLSGCTALTSIGETVFGNCSALVSLDLSPCIALSNIGRSVFYNCTALTSVDLSGTAVPPVLASDTFYSYLPINIVAIYVPAGSVDTYKAATYWSSQA